MFFDQLLLAAASAAIGGLIGGLSGYLLSYAQKRAELRALREEFEETKRQLSQTTKITEGLKTAIETQGVVGKELRDAVREVTTSVAKAIQSICWFTWMAENEGNISEELKEGYNKQIQALLPIIVGQLSVVASIDKATYLSLSKYQHVVFDLDQEVARLIIKAKKDEGLLNIEYLEVISVKATSTLLAFPDEIADIVSATMKRLLGSDPIKQSGDKQAA